MKSLYPNNCGIQDKRGSPASGGHYRLDPAHRLALLAYEKRYVAQFRHDGEKGQIVSKALSILVYKAAPFRLLVARTFTAVALMKFRRAGTELCAAQVQGFRAKP